MKGDEAKLWLMFEPTNDVTAQHLYFHLSLFKRTYMQKCSLGSMW
jgi:hypothetical protein